VGTPLQSDTFAALRSRDFRLLLFSQWISQLGAQMQRIAIAWQVYLLTHDAVALGLLGLFRVLPVFLFSLLAGLVADAQDRRRVLAWTQGGAMLASLLLAALTLTGNINVLLIYALVFLRAVANAFEGPSHQSLVPSLVPARHVANAFSLDAILGEVALIVGAGAGGILIAGLGGVGAVYALTGFSSLLALALVLCLRTTVREKFETSSISLQSTLDGFRYLRTSPVIMGAMLMDFFATFFGSANVLLPVFASDILHVGAEGYGLLAAAPSVGSIAAGALLAVRAQFRRPGALVLWAVLVYGIATTLFGLSTVFALSLFFFAITGAGDTVSMILRQTIRQLATPDALRGRLTSINMLFSSGGPQLGELEAGVVANLWGAPLAVVSGGLACILAVALVARLAPALRDYDGSHLRAMAAVE
jgi:MFS family permease